MANTDLFGKPLFGLNHPITADQIYIQWQTTEGGFKFSDVFQATNVQIQYQQQVTRRYTLSSAMNQAAIIPGRPVGTMTLGRLFVSSQQDIFYQLKGWNVCQDPAIIRINLSGAIPNLNCASSKGSYRLLGAYVTGYSFQGNADDLQVIDNVTVEFLQMTTDGWTESGSNLADYPPAGSDISTLGA
jgi:hypothetical protein